MKAVVLVGGEGKRLRALVNGGIYVLEPEVLDLTKKNGVAARDRWRGRLRSQ